MGQGEAGTSEPQPWLRAGLARALQVTADGLEDLLRMEHHDPAAPRDVVRTLVTSADAEQIEQLAINMATWDHVHGGSLARIAALAQARWARVRPGRRSARSYPRGMPSSAVSRLAVLHTPSKLSLYRSNQPPSSAWRRWSRGLALAGCPQTCGFTRIWLSKRNNEA